TCASRSDTFFAGAGENVPTNRPCPVTYDTGMSLVASVSSACVETCTFPHTTTCRTACSGTRDNSCPSFRTTRCSLRLPTDDPDPCRYRTAPSSDCGITWETAGRID